MSRTITTTVYQFHELTDNAKAAARTQYRANNLDYEWWDYIFDDAEIIAKYMGLSLRQRNAKPAIHFSGFSSQGDGACFDGTWEAAAVQPLAAANYAPCDTELRKIAMEFERIAAAYPDAAFLCQHTGIYCHPMSTQFDVHGTDNAAELVAVARDFMRWIYRRLQTEYDWLTSDAQVEDSIVANGYEFTEHGEIV